MALGLALLVLAVAAATSLPPAGAAAAERRTAVPGLRIAAKDPLAVAGRRFEPRERVRLTVISGGAKHVVRVRADGGGAFLVRFPGLRLDRCSGPLAARAVGARGSRASFALERLHCAGPAGVRAAPPARSV